ncbi:hypothetical protein GMB50_11705 [Turicibacter sanguinis]|uniref:hypothetical protein n=1 Tax=Turicibacter sanguinis TaxID=154288 RepID=UPI0012BCB2B1|nr:hypothetical protein [Turicibacter sanguinis]MDB8566259.1 hypothetical protein [Turicibacter sanguinis]MDB8568877.1 hypothetical protein [Turicibacter sanguinis]MDB8571760.1 hypothetical protein [Turicibacter sanguinis]MDB8580385.1 hypothetical protein [Turicibacter sanguinis]MTO10651.1 hypothetical protein [Turicibacter sanguinis]
MKKSFNKLLYIDIELDVSIIQLGREQFKLIRNTTGETLVVGANPIILYLMMKDFDKERVEVRKQEGKEGIRK